jgi:hypothetical protein
MESTPFRTDPLPSYLENTKSTAYRWNHDNTESTTHPSVDDDTTRDHNSPKEDEAVRLDRVKQLASLLDDLDASAKSSRIKSSQLLHSHSHSRSRSQSPVADKPQRDQSEDEDELLSDLDEMINNVPSDEDPDPLSPPPAHSTPFVRESSRKSSLHRDELFSSDEMTPRAQKTVQKTPKTVDFKENNVHISYILLMRLSRDNL